MELKNKKVNHAFYGEGTIIEYSDSYLTVQYANRTGKYQFPQAFLSGFLALISSEENSLLLEEIKKQVENKKQSEIKKQNEIKKEEMPSAAPISFKKATLCKPQENKPSSASNRAYKERVVYAQTNAEFLNSEFGTDFKGFFKSVWSYNNDTLVWMVKIDGSINSNWRNNWVTEVDDKMIIVTGKPENPFDTILEEYVGNDKSSIDVAVNEQYRIVAEKDFSFPVHKYYVRGLFKYDKENSTSFKHIWRKIDG